MDSREKPSRARDSSFKQDLFVRPLGKKTRMVIIETFTALDDLNALIEIDDCFDLSVDSEAVQ